MDESALRRRFKDGLKQAKLKPLRLHDLRHTFGTLAVQAFPLSDVRAYMGHADIATTMIYVHHVPQHDAADRLGRVVADANGPHLRAVSGHARDTVDDPGVHADAEDAAGAGETGWARVDSNHRPTDYESAALTS
jgi:hypothetical protein